MEKIMRTELIEHWEFTNNNEGWEFVDPGGGELPWDSDREAIYFGKNTRNQSVWPLKKFHLYQKKIGTVPETEFSYKVEADVETIGIAPVFVGFIISNVRSGPEWKKLKKLNNKRKVFKAFIKCEDRLRNYCAHLTIGHDDEIVDAITYVHDVKVWMTN